MIISALKTRLSRFRHDEDGAITVDWVMVTAGVVALSIAVMNLVGDSSMTVTKKISSEMSSATVADYVVQ
ncbi:MAG: hypothetical protein AAFQ47_03125 [Pseudomonadota bacterium]